MNEGIRRFGASGQTLMLIALAAMILDHTAAALPFFSQPGMEIPYRILRGIGRLAFPLFAFLLAVGATRTQDIRRYLLRLGCFALISEIPFDCAIFGRPLCWERQNVFFTLFFALLAIAVYRGAQTRRQDRPAAWLGILFWALCVAGAQLLRFDYGADGCILIFGFYLWRTEMRGVRYFPYFLILLCGLMWHSEPFQLLALLAFLPVMLYNENSGNSLPRSFFYWAYPVHLALLGAVRIGCQGGFAP